jgi:1-acyl-sn-glycerol-3-phosphate acyltransferase
MAARDNWFLRNTGKLFLGLLGWKVEGHAPNCPKCVCIVAPHTSNWDFILCVMGSFVLRVYGSWIAKHTLFYGPMGALMRWLGGIPVRRDQRNRLVEQIVAEFNGREQMVFVLTPEGTRHYTEYWRAGFYEIARQADVPVALCYADYARKACGFGPTITLTGDRDYDMAAIAAFYATITPRFPEHCGPVRLRPPDPA